MSVPSQIAIFDVEYHNGTSAIPGSSQARILDIGPTNTLTDAGVAPGALAVPLMPGTAVVTTPSLAVENIGDQPVITTAAIGAIAITIGSGERAGTYATRHDGATLTTAMIQAAPTCLIKPVVTGTTSTGSTLTVTPGLWIYAGADPGDQTWMQMLDGSPTGETALTYVIQSADAGRDFSVEETFGGVVVASAITPLSA